MANFRTGNMGAKPTAGLGLVMAFSALNAMLTYGGHNKVDGTPKAARSRAHTSKTARSRAHTSISKPTMQMEELATGSEY